MQEQPKMIFKRAGSRLEIPEINRIPRQDREAAYDTRYTGWWNRVLYVEGKVVCVV